MEYYFNTGIKTRVIEEICRLAEKNKVQKVILFGSRARGDFRERSDIDIAFYGGNGDLFCIEVDEETSTLLQYDIVNMNKTIQKELKDSIIREGMVIYEKI